MNQRVLYDIWLVGTFGVTWKGEENNSPLIIFPSFFFILKQWSWTIGVSTRTTKIKEASIIYDIIAIGFRHECCRVSGSPLNLFPINDIEMFEETSLAGPFFCEMATTHLCCGVLPSWIIIYDFSSPCNSWSIFRQDREYGRWPISKGSLVNIHPPVSPSINVLPHCTCHANQFVIFWMINKGIKTNERENKWIFLCRTTA